MTNRVTFPGLGLDFALDRVAFTLFGHPIYWYAVIIVSGFLLAWLYCSRKGPKLGISSDDLVDLLIFAVPLALIGARLYYIIFYLDLFRTADGSLDFMKMIRIWDGGLAIYGGVIVGILVLFFVCRHKKIPFLAFADLGVMGLLIGQCIGRWGNFMNVEAYGGVTTLPWRMCSEKIAGELFAQGMVDAVGYQQVIDGALGVHPTFFYESVWNFVGFFLLVWISRRLRKFDGQLFFTYLAWYGVGRGIIEGLRTDSLYFFHTTLRVSQLLSFALALVGIAFLLYFLLLKKPTQNQLWVNRKAALEVSKTDIQQETGTDEQDAGHIGREKAEKTKEEEKDAGHDH